MGSGLLWFFVGAGAATWYQKHHDLEHARYWGYGPYSREYYGHRSSPAGCGHASSMNPPVETSSATSDGPGDLTSESRGRNWPSHPPWEGRSWGWGPGPRGPLPSHAPHQGGEPASNSPAAGAPNQDQLTFVMERERIMDMSRNIGNTVSELSESALDTLMDSAAALKAKLAEQRRQREQLELERKQEEEHRRMNPPRYV
ncbi:hypothetical protein K435DRAFT_963674 [Dendrothele bispora CBS 962.96]|uniref:Uncharacterized protein n=1 Tax=Dendrothele bispora (strain CBS 962.96) TaxID=1314807 RepID=A0A4S8MEV8_DENBC|nr:hypothetical protein K435DRAFT_963674 [Dendrothele bispora CBS 962.96]